MAHIEFIDLAHSYAAANSAANWALKPTSIALRDGGAYALLGPSGCGKTTLLNIVSGLIAPTRGRILFDGRDVTALPAERRNIAQVFQFPVIYDTMTVFDNLAFPLRNRGAKSDAVRKRVHEIAQLLDVSEELNRRAGALSADLKQKISLGRGLVRSDVSAVLFDEPLTTIDPQLKWLLRRKLKQIHQELKVTLIYVTHDQTEALTFADTVLVMSQGEVVQSGDARELFETPDHTFVGHFIGSPGMNFLPCALNGDTAVVGTHSFAIDSAIALRANLSGRSFKLGFRPESAELTYATAPGAQRVRIRTVQPMGTHTLVAAELDAHPLWIKARVDARFDDDSAWMRIPPEKLLLFADERRVR